MKAAEVKDIKNKKEVTGNGNLSVTDILSKMSNDNEYFKKKIKEITSGDNSLGPGQMDIEKVVELYAKSYQNTSSKKAEDAYLKSVQNILNDEAKRFDAIRKTLENDDTAILISLTGEQNALLRQAIEIERNILDAKLSGADSVGKIEIGSDLDDLVKESNSHLKDIKVTLNMMWEKLSKALKQREKAAKVGNNKKTEIDTSNIVALSSSLAKLGETLSRKTNIYLRQFTNILVQFSSKANQKKLATAADNMKPLGEAFSKIGQSADETTKKLRNTIKEITVFSLLMQSPLIQKGTKALTDFYAALNNRNKTVTKKKVVNKNVVTDYKYLFLTIALGITAIAAAFIMFQRVDLKTVGLFLGFLTALAVIMYVGTRNMRGMKITKTVTKNSNNTNSLNKSNNSKGLGYNLMATAIGLAVLVLSIYAIKDIDWKQALILIGFLTAIQTVMVVSNLIIGKRGAGGTGSGMLGFSIGIAILLLTIEAVKEVFSEDNKIKVDMFGYKFEANPAFMLIGFMLLMSIAAAVSNTRGQNGMKGFAIGTAVLVLTIWAWYEIYKSNPDIMESVLLLAGITFVFGLIFRFTQGGKSKQLGQGVKADRSILSFCAMIAVVTAAALITIKVLETVHTPFLELLGRAVIMALIVVAIAYAPKVMQSSMKGVNRTQIKKDLPILGMIAAAGVVIIAALSASSLMSNFGEVLGRAVIMVAVMAAISYGPKLIQKAMKGIDRPQMLKDLPILGYIAAGGVVIMLALSASGLMNSTGDIIARALVMVGIIAALAYAPKFIDKAFKGIKRPQLKQDLVLLGAIALGGVAIMYALALMPGDPVSLAIKAAVMVGTLILLTGAVWVLSKVGEKDKKAVVTAMLVMTGLVGIIWLATKAIQPLMEMQTVGDIIQKAVVMVGTIAIMTGLVSLLTAVSKLGKKEIAIATVVMAGIAGIMYLACLAIEPLFKAKTEGDIWQKAQVLWATMGIITGGILILGLVSMLPPMKLGLAIGAVVMAAVAGIMWLAVKAMVPLFECKVEGDPWQKAQVLWATMGIIFGGIVVLGAILAIPVIGWLLAAGLGMATLFMGATVGIMYLAVQAIIPLYTCKPEGDLWQKAEVLWATMGIIFGGLVALGTVLAIPIIGWLLASGLGMAALIMTAAADIMAKAVAAMIPLYTVKVNGNVEQKAQMLFKVLDYVYSGLIDLGKVLAIPIVGWLLDSGMEDAVEIMTASALIMNLAVRAMVPLFKAKVEGNTQQKARDLWYTMSTILDGIVNMSKKLDKDDVSPKDIKKVSEALEPMTRSMRNASVALLVISKTNDSNLRDKVDTFKYSMLNIIGTYEIIGKKDMDGVSKAAWAMMPVFTASYTMAKVMRTITEVDVNDDDITRFTSHITEFVAIFSEQLKDTTRDAAVDMMFASSGVIGMVNVAKSFVDVLLALANGKIAVYKVENGQSVLDHYEKFDINTMSTQAGEQMGKLIVGFVNALQKLQFDASQMFVIKNAGESLDKITPVFNAVNSFVSSADTFKNLQDNDAMTRITGNVTKFVEETFNALTKIGNSEGIKGGLFGTAGAFEQFANYMDAFGKVKWDTIEKGTAGAAKGIDKMVTSINKLKLDRAIELQNTIKAFTSIQSLKNMEGLLDKLLSIITKINESQYVLENLQKEGQKKIDDTKQAIQDTKNAIKTASDDAMSSKWFADNILPLLNRIKGSIDALEDINVTVTNKPTVKVENASAFTTPQ